MRAVIKCDVLHRYHHLLKKSRLINQIYVCVEHAVFLEINYYYLCISISENTTGGLALSHNNVSVPS